MPSFFARLDYSANRVFGDLPSIDATAIGFTVGAHAGYQFQLKEYPLDVDYADTFVSYAYDAYGRKISETNFGGADVGFVETAKTLFVYDGWRLLEEVSVDPSDNSTHVVADDVPGPAYVDDIVANRRDLDHSGSLASDEQFYHLTDQQYSTVALLAGDGNPAERYGYDPFGAPSLYNGSGDPEYDPHNTAELTTKSDFNPNLYTGQRYLPEAKLYDSRNRLYNPAQGRFLTADPLGNFGDAANLGNGYSYVGNNPGSGVDPFGLSMDLANPGWSSWWGGFWAAFGDFSGSPNQKPVANEDLFAPVDDLEQRAARGDSTKGAVEFQSDSDVAKAYGKEAIRWGANVGAAAPVIGPIISGGLAADDALNKDWAGAILHGSGAILGTIDAGGEAAGVGEETGGAGVRTGEQMEFNFAAKNGAQLGQASTNDYRATFFSVYPDLRGKVIVHHAIEQRVVREFPGVVTESEIHSIENLRGIPVGNNSDLHLSQIRKEWNSFYSEYRTSGNSPTKQQLLDKATEIDQTYGLQFAPQIGGRN